MPMYRCTFKYLGVAYVDVQAASLTDARIAATGTPRESWTWPEDDVRDIQVISHEMSVIGPLALEGEPEPERPNYGSGYD